MAIVAVTADNTRVEDAESGTGWNNIGGGAGGAAEGSFPYQGNNLYNRKVTGTSGFYYDPTSDAGSAQNMTTAALRTMMVKAIVTDYAGLNGVSGLRIRIGSGTTAFYQYVIAGSNAKINALAEYPARGGLIIIPIDPNIAAYRDSTTGSPVLTAVDYFGLEANFDSSTAKSENVGLDAIDLGRGLILTGGDGADPDAVWQDFVDADEGTTANRYGFATASLDAVKQFFGTMQIGNASAAVFNDTTSQILWLDGLFQNGWSRVLVDLQNASTNVTDGATHTGLGDTTNEDTRPDYTVTGANGSFTFNGILNNFRKINLSKGSISNATIEAAQIDLNGTATAIDSTLIAITQDGAGTRTNFLAQADIANITDCVIRKDNTETNSHAILITTPGTYTFDGLTFSGWGADASNTAAVYNNSGGAVTINVTGGGNTPTVLNGTSATTTVNNNTQVTLSGLPIGVEVRVYNDTGSAGSPVAGTEINGIETTVSSTFSFTAPATSDVIIVIFDEDQIRDGGVYQQYQVPNNDATLPFSLLSDRVFLNPT